MSDFGNRLKLLRENQHLSQKELANILNVGNSTLSQYESGKRVPADDVKMQIAQYFNVSLDYLLGNETNEENKKDDKIQTIAAHFDGDMTQEEMEEIINFVKYIKSKRD